MSTTSAQSLRASNLSTHPAHLPTTAQNASQGHHGCIEFSFSEMDFLPWNNPDNIVSTEVEAVISRIENMWLALLFLIGGPGNVINMTVFYKQGLKDRVNLCLFALALADELYLITLMVYNGEQLLLHFTTGERPGPLNIFLTNHHFIGLMGFGYVSCVLSAVIASERCHCVLRPLTYHTVMRTRTMVALIAVIYIVTTSLYFITFGFRIRYVCVYDPVSGLVGMSPILGIFYTTHKYFLDLLRSALFGAGMPGVVIVVVTVTTVVTSVKLRQIVTWRAGTTSSLSAREVGLTRMLVGSSVLFIICILPTALARNISLVYPEVDAGRRHHNLFLCMVWISQLFTYFNSSVNICVYYVMGSRYRETFWALCGKTLKAERKSI